MHIGNITHWYISGMQCTASYSIKYINPQVHAPTNNQTNDHLFHLHSAAITPSTPATPAKLNPTPPVTCAPAADEVSSELPDVCVEVDVPVASPCEFVNVDSTVLLDALPDELPDPDDDGLDVALALATDPDDGPDVMVLCESMLPASLVALVNALPASLLRCDAAPLPAVLMSEAMPAAPVAAVDTAPSASLLALETSLLMLLSWARTAVEDRRRMEARDLRCILEIEVGFW